MSMNDYSALITDSSKVQKQSNPTYLGLGFLLHLKIIDLFGSLQKAYV